MYTGERGLWCSAGGIFDRCTFAREPGIPGKLADEEMSGK